MAETLLSPGVLARENDQSFITAQPVQAGAAIVGPTVKGPLVPTLVTTYSQFQNTFGTTITSGSSVYTYLTSIAAYNYFQQGGETLLVGRVVPGTDAAWSSATSSFISGSDASVYGKPVFELETLSKGEIMNSGTGSAQTDGSLDSGSYDNLRWEITAADTASGTFALLIRRGDDNTVQKTVLETWSGLSLDPKASNYIARVIGDQAQNIRNEGSTYYVDTTGSFANASNYVRVKAVNYKTPDYFDNSGEAKVAYTKYIPVNASGTFDGAIGSPFSAGEAKFYDKLSASNTQGLATSDYTRMLYLMANKEEYNYNVITMPGLNRVMHASPISSLIANTQERGDAIAVIDTVGYGATVTAAKTQAIAVDSSYAATYWPWLQTSDPDTGENVWVPASTLIPAVYAFNDNASEAWFAPAGFNRGGLSTVVRAERKLTQAERDSLYQSNVNPIATFPNNGVVVFGQKTLQKRASALDRVNVRRLLIELKDYISQIGDTLVFEQNSIATRNKFLAKVNPYLDSIQQRQGLYAFKVVMDDSNNTADVIDRNQLVGQIYIQPTKTAEYIVLDFNVLPTGAVFPS